MPLPETLRAADDRASFLVGLSHPWVRCGHDFGPGPPAWGCDRQADWDAVEAELRRWRVAAGVTWSRWWLLAGGVNYPVGRDPDACFRRRGGTFIGAPPPLPPAFLEDFEGLLRAASRAGVKVLPSLLSFEFFLPMVAQAGGRAFSGGRAPIVFGDRDSPPERFVDAFLDATLTPLLEVSSRHRAAIGAWELANEPDWVVSGGPFHVRFDGFRPRRTPKTVPRSAMCTLIERGVDRIVSHGFVASVGFKVGDPPWLLPRLRRKLRRYGDNGQYVHQLHYYPSLVEPRVLPRHDRLPFRPCLVGEMPTAIGRRLDPFVMRWRDDRDRQRGGDPGRYLERRLDIVRRKGYPGALLWSGRATDRVSAWGPAQWTQVRRALGSR